MISYIIRRLLMLIPTVFIISILAFVVIELPPGDFVSMCRVIGQLIGIATARAIHSGMVGIDSRNSMTMTSPDTALVR